MFKRFLIFFVGVALSAACSTVPDAGRCKSIWVNPSADSNRRNGQSINRLSIDSVLFCENETVLKLTVSGAPGENPFRFRKTTSLRSGDKTYSLLKLDGASAGKPIVLDKSGKVDLSFHFEPLPEDITSFDFYQGANAFNVYGIHQFDKNSGKLMNTHWRNPKTGDWIFSFTDDYVLYANKIWKYEGDSISDTQDNLSFKMAQDGQVATVEIGGNNSGVRTFDVDLSGEKSSYVCERFESGFVPDYPPEGKDMKLKDYGYDNVDSVRISGLIVSSYYSHISEASILNPFSGEQEDYTQEIGDDGVFSFSFPIANSTYARFHFRQFVVGLPLEPGHEYFLYWNRDLGQTYVMGEDSRLLNEDVAHPVYWVGEPDPDPQKMDYKEYFAKLLEVRDHYNMQLENIRKEHPTLSDAYFDLKKIGSAITLYSAITRSGCFGKEGIPQELMDYMIKDIENISGAPYTIALDFPDFAQGLYESLSGEKRLRSEISALDIYRKTVDGMSDTWSPDDKEAMDMYFDAWSKVESIRASDIDDKSKKAQLDKLLWKERAYIEKGESLMLKYWVNAFCNSEIQKITKEKCLENLISSVGELNCDKAFKDLIVSGYLSHSINDLFHSLSPEVIGTYDAAVSSQAMKDRLHELNGRFLEIEKDDLQGCNDVVPDEELAMLSDGKAILNRITAPFKGKTVYVDVWSTLDHKDFSHDVELKESLSDYDIVYLYLASHSPEDTWKAVLKAYNLTGENCYHYNLPAREQYLVEKYLKVKYYSSYRLIDKNGKLHNMLPCNPWNPEMLKISLDRLQADNK